MRLCHVRGFELPLLSCRLEVQTDPLVFSSIHKLYHVRPTFPDLSNMLRSLAKDREHRPWDVAIEPTLSDPSSSATPASPGRKWRFRMESYGKTIDMVQQQSMMKELRHLDMKGKIALKGNDLLEFSIFEECQHPACT